MKTPVIAFKAKNKDNRFLCDGQDCFDWEDEFGDVTDISEALLIVSKDLSKPDEKNIEEFYKWMSLLSLSNNNLSNNIQFIKDNYDPVDLEITPEQLATVRERNEW